jgi:hypothetical protein
MHLPVIFGIAPLVFGPKKLPELGKEDDATCFSRLLDLNMLVMTGGRERSKVEFCALLDAADYKLTRIVPTMAPQSVIEAVPKLRRPA